jgi:hypothetical protein
MLRRTDVGALRTRQWGATEWFDPVAGERREVTAEMREYGDALLRAVLQPGTRSPV